jgi:hypothetical protein
VKVKGGVPISGYRCSTNVRKGGRSNKGMNAFFFWCGGACLSVHLAFSRGQLFVVVKGEGEGGVVCGCVIRARAVDMLTQLQLCGTSKTECV